MKKVFIESKEIPKRTYRGLIFCDWISQCAKDYIKEKRKIFLEIDYKTRDKVLVDAINFIAHIRNCNFKLSENDLYNKKFVNVSLEYNSFLSLTINYFSTYIFEYNINNYNGNCEILLDFINYIFEKYNYNRVFTLNELKEKSKKQVYIKDLVKLKIFLTNSSKYIKRLLNGETIDSIFTEIEECNSLNFYSKNEKYYYENYMEILENTQKNMWQYEIITKEEKIYALAYSYYKLYNKYTNIPTINQKIKEMRN